MMRMMGLGTSAYWVINYIFWLILYTLFSVIFIFVGSVVSLPSGYKLGLFTRQSYRFYILLDLKAVQSTPKIATMSILSCN
jgi:hypothetical protein